MCQDWNSPAGAGSLSAGIFINPCLSGCFVGYGSSWPQWDQGFFFPPELFVQLGLSVTAHLAAGETRQFSFPTPPLARVLLALHPPHTALPAQDSCWGARLESHGEAGAEKFPRIAVSRRDRHQIKFTPSAFKVFFNP